MSAGFKGLEQNLRSTGAGLVALGAAPTVALVGITKAAISFEDAFAGVRKTVDASEAEFKQIAKNFREIAKVTPITAVELSRIGELAGQLGVKGVKNITKFAKVMADISVTTNLTAENASTAFARIVNIMQEPIENVDRMGAVVVELGNNFATTEAEIVEFATRIAGAGSIAGLTTDEIFGIGAAMSSVGVQAEAGGTAVQKVLIAMNTAVAQGNEDLTMFAETAGLTLDEFKDLSAIERFNSFVLGLGEAGDDAVTILEELGLQDQRLVRSFLSLANAGDLVTESSESASKAWKDNTALTEEAAKRYETVASQMTILKNNVTEVALVLGEALLPKIIEIVDKVKPLIERFTELAEKHPNLITGLLAVGAALGVLGAALVAISFMLPALGVIFSATGAIVIAVISAIVVMFFMLKNSIENAKESIEYWQNTVIPGIIAKFNEWKESLRVFIESVVLWFSEMPEKVMAFIKKLFVQDIPSAVGFAIGWLSVKIPEIIKNVIMWFQELPGKVNAVFEEVKKKIIEKLTAAWEWVKTEVPTWPSKIKGFLESIPGKIAKILDELIKTVTDKLLDAPGSAWKKILEFKDKVVGAFNSVRDAVRDAISAFKEGISLGIGGTGGGESRQTGGMVPGPIGAPIGITAHGGERVIPAGVSPQRGGGGGSVVFEVNIGMYAGTETEKRDIARELYASLVQTAQSQNKTVEELFGEV